MNYLKDISFLYENNLIEKDSAFNYYDTPQEELFDMFYLYCKETLTIQKFAEIAKPSFVYFNNNTTVNASASEVRQFGIISFNIGLFIWIEKILNQNESFNKIIQYRFPLMYSKLDVQVSKLNFQIAAQFTFYHELGHLLQLSNKNEDFNFQEKCNNDFFDLTRHILEINSDSFSSICVSTTLLQYFENIYCEEFNAKEFNNCMVLTGICLFSYFLEMSSVKNTIYFYEKSYPHAYIRLYNALIHMLNCTEQSELLKSKEIKVEIGQLIKEVVNTYIVLERASIFNTSFYQTFEEASQKQNEINNYIFEMNQFNIENYINAIDIWRETM